MSMQGLRMPQGLSSRLGRAGVGAGQIVRLCDPTGAPQRVPRRVIAFEVLGIPVPQGSKSKSASGHLYEANKNLEPWRDSVRWQARLAMRSQEPLSGPVRVTAHFYFPRPQSHFRRVQKAPVLRDDAPVLHSVKPDVDKLLRAVLDAMTKECFKDDSQVSWVEGRKFYGKPRAEISVEPLP